MPSQLKVVTVKLPASILRRIPRERSRSGFIRAAVTEKLARMSAPEWQPTTRRGKRLLQLSNKYSGEKLSAEQIAAELQERRGGLA